MNEPIIFPTLRPTVGLRMILGVFIAHLSVHWSAPKLHEANAVLPCTIPYPTPLWTWGNLFRQICASESLLRTSYIATLGKCWDKSFKPWIENEGFCRGCWGNWAFLLRVLQPAQGKANRQKIRFTPDPQEMAYNLPVSRRGNNSTPPQCLSIRNAQLPMLIACLSSE